MSKEVGDKNMTRKETLERDKEIKKLLDDGMTHKSIAENFYITKQRVTQIDMTIKKIYFLRTIIRQ